jgi:P4 family phage/plasmid primase-like protien
MEFLPQKRMYLTRPYSKGTPISTISTKNNPHGEKISWTTTQHKTNFTDHYTDPKSFKWSDGCNIAYIPQPEEFWVLDLDYDKGMEHLFNEQLEAFEKIVECSLEHCQHLVKTPHGWHCYYKPNNLINRTGRYPYIDIQYQNVYVLAPNSILKKRVQDKKSYEVSYEFIGEYTQTKWEGEVGDMNSELEVLLRSYMETHVAKPKKKIITNNSGVQDVVTVDEELLEELEPSLTDDELLLPCCNLVHWFQRGPKDKRQHFKELGELTNSYKSWYYLAKIMKQSNLIGNFEAFNYISKCNDKYYEHDVLGKTELEACRHLWDGIKTKILEKSSAKIVVGGPEGQTPHSAKPNPPSLFENWLIKKDKWILNSLRIIKTYSEHNAIASMMRNWIYVSLRSQYETSKTGVFYCLDYDDMIWYETKGTEANVQHYISNKYRDIKKKLTEVVLFPIIAPNVLNWDEPKTLESKWDKMKYGRNGKWCLPELDKKTKKPIRDAYNWDTDATLEEKGLFQQYYLSNLLNSTHNLERNSSYKNIWGYLRSQIVDKNLYTKMDVIPNIFPLKDAFCIDLKTGDVIPRTPENYFSFCSDISSKEYLCAKNNNCSWFVDEYLANILGTEEDRLNYVVKTLGMGICGDPCIAKVFVLFIGCGRNGKSKLLDLYSKICGKQFYRNLPSNFWNQTGSKASSGASTDEASCKGCRVIVQDEQPPNAILDTDRMRRFSGGGDITARHLYQNCGESFKASFLPILCSNELPQLPNLNQGIEGRGRVFDFQFTFFDEGDPKYDKNNNKHKIGNNNINEDAYDNHKGGILYQLVNGAIQVHKDGLSVVPKTFQDNWDTYAEDNNILKRFINEMLIPCDETDTLTNEIHDRYKFWATSVNYEAQQITSLQRNGDYYVTKAQFEAKFQEMGFIVKRGVDNGKRYKRLQKHKLRQIDYFE